jgi:phosphohistidine phosphatase
MRRLILLRHAKSDWSIAGQRDLDRALSTRGRQAAPLVGAYMAHHGLIPDQAIVSTARRARETWELIAPAFKQDLQVAFDERLYESAAQRLLDVIRDTSADVHSLLLLGHNPGLQELAALLMASGEIDARQRLLEKFPTAGLAVLDFPIDEWRRLHPHAGRLDRFVTPRAIEAEPD